MQFVSRTKRNRFGRNPSRAIRQSSIAAATRHTIEQLEDRVLLAVITSLVDPFTGPAVDTVKWSITTRGLENSAPTTYDAPTEDVNGLRLGGTTGASYWYGTSLESVDSFSSQANTTVSVDRVSVAGTGTAYRASLWILQPGGQYLHFSQNVGENGWQYNLNNGGGGTTIASFNTAHPDHGDHVMKLVYTPGSGQIADIGIFLDGVLGTTVHLTNWDQSIPFKVILTGQGRKSGDTVSAVFKSLDAEASPIPTIPPTAPTNLTAAAPRGVTVNLSWLDTANNEINYRLERSTDNVNFTEIAVLPPLANSGTTGTYTDTVSAVSTKYYYRVRAFNNANGGAFSAYSTANVTTPAALFTFSDPLTGAAVDTNKWDITNRGLEQTGPAGYNAPTEDPTNGLTLSGTTTGSYWYGKSLETKDVFDSRATNTVTVDRFALTGTGTAWRSSIWLLQSGGQFFHFSQNVNEPTGWEFNQTIGGSGVAVPAFNTVTSDGGEHFIKLVYTPLGGTNATVDMYLDGNLGATATFTNWNNTVPFKVILTGQGRKAGDTVSAQFKDLHVDGVLPPAPPVAPSGLTATASATGVDLQWTDNADNELNYSVERSIDGTNFTSIAALPASPGTGATMTYSDGGGNGLTTYFYRVRAFNYAALGSFSSSHIVAGTAPASSGSLVDPLTNGIDPNVWDITNRGLENTGEAGYNSPFSDPFGLQLSGVASQQYWFGKSVETRQTFSSATPTTIQVDRVALSGEGIFRSSLWILQPGGQFLHFAQNVGESLWEYNQTIGNVGVTIPSFNAVANDGNEHIMKLVYTPLGGANATVDMYLDGNYGATATFNNWDNSVPFKVILTGQARKINDFVNAEFRDVSVTPTVVPPVVIPGTADADVFYVKRNADGVHGDLWFNSPTPGTGTPTQQFNLTQLATLEIDGLGAADRLTVDYSAGSPIPTGGLVFQGGAGTDTLKVIGAGASDALGLSGVTFNHLGGGSLTAPSVENLAITKANVATPSLTLNTGNFSAVDLGIGGTLRVVYAGASPAAAIRGYITTGRAGGAWNGPGISSADVAAHSGTALGYIDSDGIVTVKYVLAGDVNLDGAVGFADLVAVAQNYGASDPNITWARGDVTYDGLVGFPDLVAVAQTYGQVMAAAPVPAAPVSASPVSAPVSAAPVSVPVSTAAAPAAPKVATPVLTVTTPKALAPAVTVSPKLITPAVASKVVVKPTPVARPVAFAAHTSLPTLSRAQVLDSDVLGKKTTTPKSIFR